MIERKLKNLLEAGVANLTANPDILKDILIGTVGLDEAEADHWVTFWNSTEENRGAPTVYHGYPRTKATSFPSIFIILSSDNESQKHLGDFVGNIEVLGGSIERGNPVRGSFFTGVYTHLVMAQHPDVCVVYYQILKALMYAIDDALIEAGALETTIAGGDMAPDKTWIPDGFWVRQLTLTVNSEFCIGVNDGLSRAWKVNGIHIDKTGAPGQDVGDVRTLVSPYVKEPTDG